MLAATDGGDRRQGCPRSSHFLDMRPVRVLHERPRSLNLAAAENAIPPARKAAPSVTEQTTRLVLPSHIEAVADAAAASMWLGKTSRVVCSVTEGAAFLAGGIAFSAAAKLSERGRSCNTRTGRMSRNVPWSAGILPADRRHLDGTIVAPTLRLRLMSAPYTGK